MKFTENQLRALSYRVKKEHCFRVPVYSPKSDTLNEINQHDDDDDIFDQSQAPTGSAMQPECQLSAPVCQCPMEQPVIHSDLPSMYNTSEEMATDTDIMDNSVVAVPAAAMPTAAMPTAATPVSDMPAEDDHLRRSSRSCRKPRHLQDYVS